MSIYPERGRNGFTGRWINETRQDGRKIRTYHDSLEAAQGSPNATPREQEITLGDLDSLASHKIWRGTKDELQSQQRFQVCVSLLGRNTPLSRIRKVQLEELVDKLRDNDRRGAKTINRHLAALSAALRWAHEADMIPGMPYIPWQKEPPGRKVYLPENMDHVFLEAVESVGGPEARLATHILLATGMRIGELLKLTERDIRDDTIHLEDTKAGRPRAIPITRSDAEDLRGWLRGHHVGYRDILRAINAASLSACGFKLTPHALRHTVATRLVAKGVNALTVAQIMGHSSLSTTRLYTHHEVTSLRAAMQSVSLGSSRASDRMEDVCSVENAEKKGGLSPRRSLCSPLRSHSATRPKDSQDRDLYDDWVVVKS